MARIRKFNEQYITVFNALVKEGKPASAVNLTRSINKEQSKKGQKEVNKGGTQRRLDKLVELGVAGKQDYEYYFTGSIEKIKNYIPDGAVLTQNSLIIFEATEAEDPQTSSPGVSTTPAASTSGEQILVPKGEFLEMKTNYNTLMEVVGSLTDKLNDYAVQNTQLISELQNRSGGTQLTPAHQSSTASKGRPISSTTEPLDNEVLEFLGNQTAPQSKSQMLKGLNLRKGKINDKIIQDTLDRLVMMKSVIHEKGKSGWWFYSIA